jgi:anti-sigma factor RsiW
MTADIHTLSGAYALNAVNDLERAEFDRHLAECDTCAQEVAGLVGAATSMADSTWSVAPPGMRDRVLREINQTPQVRPGSGRSGFGRSGSGRRAASRRGTGWGGAGSGQPSRWRTWAPTAAAAAILVVASASGAYLLDQVRDERGQVRQAQQQLTGIQQVLGAGDVELNSSQAPGGGRMSVAVSRQQDRAVTTLAGLRAPLPGKCYTLWRMQDGTPVRAGLFDAGQAGGSRLVDDIGKAQLVALTEESCATPPDKPSMDPIAATAI